MATEQIRLTRPRFANIVIRLEGITPYLPGKLPKYAIDQIESIRRAENTKIKTVVTTDMEYQGKFHLLDDSKGPVEGNYGIPVGAFYGATKQAANKAYWPGGIDGKKWGIAVQLKGTVLPLTYKNLVKRQDVVIQQRVPKLDYRPEFQDWSVEVPVRFNTSLLTVDTVLAVFDLAGTLGVGKWRPSAPKGGTFGTFKVASVSSVKEEKLEGTEE